MLGAVLLSQRRFGEAIAEGNRARAADARDAWNYGAIGDGYMELGDYTRAFEAFDRMGQLAPGPSAYARTSYALEIKGDLDGALEFMRMAADGTSPNDPEAQAWHFSQAGDLLMHLGEWVRPSGFRAGGRDVPQSSAGHRGTGGVKIADGEWSAARLLLQGELAKAPTPDLAAAIGDLSEALGDHAGAASSFRCGRADRAGRVGEQSTAAAGTREIPGRPRQEYSRSGEPGRRSRPIAAGHLHDGRLAAAYWKAGRLADARTAADAALRTGSRDARVLWHAAEIRAAAGEPAAALELLRRIPARETIADVRVRTGFTRCTSVLPTNSDLLPCTFRSAGTVSALVAPLTICAATPLDTKDKTCLQRTCAKRSWKRSGTYTTPRSSCSRRCRNWRKAHRG